MPNAMNQILQLQVHESFRVATLSQREREVLALIAEGLSMKEIAYRLSISPRTADTHKQRIFEKLGVNKSIAAARVAIRCGLVAC
jgi:two-component system, NarL family, invasion response regulator UvrY